MLIFMNNPAASRILWNEAAGKGFLLGLFTFLCRILSQSITLNGPSSGTAVLGIVIWFIQFAGCIWLMKVFMERLAAKYDGVVLSRILSMSIPKKDPFSSFMDKQEK